MPLEYPEGSKVSVGPSHYLLSRLSSLALLFSQCVPTG